MLNGEYAQAGGLGGEELPFFKNYYGGGVGSVRGYKASSLGKVDVDSTTGEEYRVGGNRRVVASSELLWSLPGMEKSFRMGLFLDAGQVYAEGEKLDIGEIRYATGLSAAWLSPVGPLKFSFARPLNKKDGDKSEAFQFQLGSTF